LGVSDAVRVYAAQAGDLVVRLVIRYYFPVEAKGGGGVVGVEEGEAEGLPEVDAGDYEVGGEGGVGDAG